ncbi:hypothetical protein LPB144_05495 [Christiangramia salexigens]|uniref:Uncharacterized protein n=1 Tax=Christiangramia salexigens TaxID=1913577 RepID=A0A1L3J465_9FLAO|nr:hypothetical protein [Christiangramia salexigens]APG59900.1 hypothetical protein LPB144_05495 [Christiangramia salexigens]
MEEPGQFSIAVLKRSVPFIFDHLGFRKLIVEAITAAYIGKIIEGNKPAEGSQDNILLFGFPAIRRYHSGSGNKFSKGLLKDNLHHIIVNQKDPTYNK